MKETHLDQLTFHYALGKMRLQWNQRILILDKTESLEKKPLLVKPALSGEDCKTIKYMEFDWRGDRIGVSLSHVIKTTPIRL